MAYQALYRKYRPKSFDDFIDQDNIKKILINSIKNNTISHAYLFSGPRGIGKTSMAKIFAKAINCLNFEEKNDVCDECDNCLDCNENTVDIVEIDAASNNGVDQIRDLKNRISIVPSKLKYKVYIIDEVHMLTNSAFNALLKTLEEPPSHVVFILATTEFYEVPETIVSRCQCYSFNRISMNSLQNRLKMIAEREMIEIDDDTIREIAYSSNGGLRDAIGMLDKLHSFTKEKINMDVFKLINSIISFEDINLFYNYIFDGDINKILKEINKIEEQGYDFKNFIEREMLFVRDKIVDYYEKSGQIDGSIDQNIEFVNILNEILIKLKDSINPIIIVQVYLLQFVNKFISREIKKDEKIISQEIKNEENNDNKNISREIKLSKETNDLKMRNDLRNEEKIEKKCKNGDLSAKISVNLENKRIRINNTMATANMNLKKKLLSKWEILNQFFMDEKYGKISQLLSDTVPMVVGENNVILTTNSMGIIDNIYNNLTLTEDFIESIYQKVKIVVLSNNEFEDVKNKYILDKKNNIVYQVEEECGKLIEEGDNLINKAINTFGADLVDIE